MNPHLTNLQKLFAQLAPYNDIDQCRNQVIRSFIHYIQALNENLTPTEETKLKKLLYQLLKSIENHEGF